MSDRTTYRAQIDWCGIDNDTSVECGSCEWSGTASEVLPVIECSLTPGDPSPIGRCPGCDGDDCGALCYVVKPEAAESANDSPSWWREHSRNAMTQGWDIFERDDTGKLELCKIDDPENVAAELGLDILAQVFEKDEQAAAYVKEQAAAGNVTCRAAIELLIAEKSPDVELFGLVRNW